MLPMIFKELSGWKCKVKEEWKPSDKSNYTTLWQRKYRHVNINIFCFKMNVTQLITTFQRSLAGTDGGISLILE